MSSLVAPPSPTTVATPYRIWRKLVPLLMLALGMALGIALTIVTILWPRQKELSGRHAATTVFKQFNPLPTLQAASPSGAWSIKTGIDERMFNRGPWGKWFVFQGHVPMADQGTAFNQFTSSLQSSLYQVRPGAPIQIWNTGSETSIGSNGTDSHFYLSYQDSGVYGCIHCWAFGQGESLRVFVTIYEP